MPTDVQKRTRNKWDAEKRMKDMPCQKDRSQSGRRIPAVK